jgi:hypothetical protein
LGINILFSDKTETYYSQMQLRHINIGNYNLIQIEDYEDNSRSMIVAGASYIGRPREGSWGRQSNGRCCAEEGHGKQPV